MHQWGVGARSADVIAGAAREARWTPCGRFTFGRVLRQQTTRSNILGSRDPVVSSRLLYPCTFFSFIFRNPGSSGPKRIFVHFIKVLKLNEAGTLKQLGWM